MREERLWIAEFLKSRPPSEVSSKSPSSHDSMRVVLEVIEAMRAAKLRLLAAMLVRARGGVKVDVCMQCRRKSRVQNSERRVRVVGVWAAPARTKRGCLCGAYAVRRRR